MKRGSVRKKDSRLVNLWVPELLLVGLDRAVAVSDSDRSKFIRNAIREKAASIGIEIPEHSN